MMVSKNLENVKDNNQLVVTVPASSTSKATLYLAQ